MPSICLGGASRPRSATLFWPATRSTCQVDSVWKTGQVPDDPQQEVRNILDQIQAVLAEAGMTMDDLVTVQVFCSDVGFFGDFNAVYTRLLHRRPAGARVCGQRHPLAGGAVRSTGYRGQTLVA